MEKHYISLEEARDAHAFLTLREITSLPYEGKGHSDYDNQALAALNKRKGDVELLISTLADLGFRKLRPYDWGSNAFLGYSTQGQLVRISPIGYDLPLGTEADRPDCPRVLGSIQCHKIFGSNSSLGWKIEVLNEVRDKAPTYAEMAADHKNLKVFLAKLGFYVWDPKPENVRRLSDGTPIIVDPDTVRRPDMGAEEEYSSIRYWSSQPPPPYYWGERENRQTWKQVQLFPQLNPTSSVYQKVLGVITNAQLATLSNRLGRDAPLVRAIWDDGLYPDQLESHLQEQLKLLMPDAFVAARDIPNPSITSRA